MKYIAVITKNYNFAFNWLKNEIVKEDLNFVSLSKREVAKKDNTRFILVSREDQVAGYEFSSYLISPDYSALEEYVKSKVR